MFLRQLFFFYMTRLYVVASRHPKFDIDRVELEVKFKEAQKLLHPDKYAVKSKVCC